MSEYLSKNIAIISPKKFWETNDYSEDLLKNLAGQLFTIAGSKAGLLQRSFDYYKDILSTSSEKVLLALDGSNTIVGSGYMFAYDTTIKEQDVAELGGVYAQKGYKGLATTIVKELVDMSSKKGFIYQLMTVKPKTAGNSGMIMVGLKSGFVPVDFALFDEFPEMYKECCVCADQNIKSGGKICGLRHTTCLLMMRLENLTQEQVNKYVVDYMQSPSFAKAIPRSLGYEQDGKFISLYDRVEEMTLANVGLFIT